MDSLSLKRLMRLSVGFFIAAVPLMAFLSIQTLPMAAFQPPAAPSFDQSNPNALGAMQIISQTQTALAQTADAQTSTSVAQTMTVLPGTQTAIARTQTAVAQPTGTAVLVDHYEPNDTLQTAFTTAADAPALCAATLWPMGDVDYFRFPAKAGASYEIFTRNLVAGLDTFLTVYDTQGNEITANDDYVSGSKASRVVIMTGISGYYYARVTNQSPLDPAGKTYCFEVLEQAWTPTPPPSTRVPGADACEFNGSFETACTIGVGESFNANFVPLFGTETDNDFYRLWVKPGFYTCQTANLSAFNDTNLIMYNQDRVGLAGSEQLTRESVVSAAIAYTGWLYVLVGPVVPIDYEESHLYTYSVRCDQTLPPTATATPTRVPAPGGGGGGVPPAATPTPFEFPTQFPTPTPFFFETPLPTPRPVVIINPLPTPTRVGPPAQSVTVNVTIYYDANLNYTPELNEGIADVAVALYDQTTGQLLAFGYSNDAGMIQFSGISATGPIRVSVPFLNFSQIVANSQANILIRVAPQPLPIGIP
jgi:hypothetical protein